LLNLLGQKIDIPACREPKDTKSTGILPDDIQRVRADRACGTEYGKRTGGHERRYDSPIITCSILNDENPWLSKQPVWEVTLAGAGEVASGVFQFRG
jgi:hypothetical protein